MRKVLLILLSLAFVTVGFAGTSFALPSDLILDTYLHPNDTDGANIGVDVIGDSSPFDFFGYRWINSTLEIYTNWDAGLEGSNLGAYLGDVFFYNADNYDPSKSDGVIGALALRDHDSNLGENDGIVKGDFFFVDGGFRYSNAYFPSTPTEKYGDEEFVTASGGLRSHWDIVYDETGEDGIWMISVNFDGLDLISDANYSDLMVRLQHTCANDVMAASVPEPATLLLLGTGLMGLAGFGRRKFKNR